MKSVDIVITINLRDYAAFEDLAIELGYPVIDIVQIRDTSKPVEPVKPTKKTSSKARFRLTRKRIKAIQDYRKQNEGVTTVAFHKMVVKNLGYDIGESTVGHVINGKYNHILAP